MAKPEIGLVSFLPVMLFAGLCAYFFFNPTGALPAREELATWTGRIAAPPPASSVMRPVQLDQWPLRAQYESKCGVEDDVTAALERAYASDLPVTVTYSEKTNYLKMTPEKYFPVYAVSVPGVIDRTYADCAAQVKWNSKILAWIFASITLVVLLQLAWRYLRREPA